MRIQLLLVSTLMASIVTTRVEDMATFRTEKQWQQDLQYRREFVKRQLASKPKSNIVVSHTVSCVIDGGNMTSVWRFEGQFNPHIASEVILHDTSGLYNVPHEVQNDGQVLTVTVKRSAPADIAKVLISLKPVQLSSGQYECRPQLQLPWVPRPSSFMYDSYRLWYEKRWLTIILYVFMWTYLVTLLQYCIVHFIGTRLFYFLQRNITIRFTGKPTYNLLTYPVKG
ncbi:membrane glycoprotein US7 [Human betaherpesvirus 5]|uniref:Membrane glycoprotein US7 n=1 Tax=Human cytomegalovirus TaxID=10359 RepID=A0A0G2TK47_HCMV|nr:membrane glycoprotein US7 [Human betaherpesvirus 5]